MKIKIFLYAGIAVLAAATQVLPALACMPMTDEAPVSVVDESAVIVWDAVSKQEQFIRTASFRSKAHDIGFLVPTPNTPDLEEADRRAFDILVKALEPQVEDRTKCVIRWDPILFRQVEHTFNAAGNVMTDDGGVQVLQYQSVAGYDATTLKANDGAGLSRWLKRNGYVAGKGSKEWFDFYIKKKWVITAFKIRKQDVHSQTFSSSLVRMSFRTEKPFFPYREPESQRTGKASKTPRSLRVFFIGDQRVAGALGAMEKTAWPGEAKWSDTLANHLTDEERTRLAKYLALSPYELQASARMTSFDDYSSPRPGYGDLFFSPSNQQDTIVPPPIIIWKTHEIWVPMDLLFMLWMLAIIAYVVWRARKRNALKAAS
jgi:hypothetical protein